MKKSIIPVAAFIAGMAIVPSVFAAEGNKTTDIVNGATLRDCLAATDKDTGECVLKDNTSWKVESGKTINVTKAMVLDLNGKKLTIVSDGTTATPFDIKENGSLTIKNGTIENLSTQKINVEKNGTLIIDANVKSTVVAGEASHIVLGAGRTLEGNLEVNGGTDYTVFGAGAANVEINGHIDGYYSQGNNVNATINGSITYAGDAVKVANGGTLTLNGARISSTTGKAVVLSGKDGNLAIKGCSELTAATATGATLFIDGNAEVASLTINNSTLKNTAGSVINGAGVIETVTINDSRFEAKAETAVKAGSTTFTNATYDGTVIGTDENVLQDAKGTWGAETVACDAAAADEGKEEGEEGAENPNTADTIATYLTIATVALLGLGATAFVAKKSNR